MTVPTKTMTEYGTFFETYIAMELVAYIDYTGLHDTDLTYYRPTMANVKLISSSGMRS